MIVLALISAYILGSIPFGYLIAKIWNIDIRCFGSGNIGATNVLRTLGPIPGSMVFLLDLLKGTLAIYLIQRITAKATIVANPWIIILAGVLAILGHMFPVFLKFKGGRGAATGLGVLLGIAPDIFLGAVILAVLIIWLTRYVSIASMTTSLVVTSAFFTLKRPFPYGLAAALITILIFLRHIPNIKRLIQGIEPRIGSSSRSN